MSLELAKSSLGVKSQYDSGIQEAFLGDMGGPHSLLQGKLDSRAPETISTPPSRTEEVRRWTMKREEAGQGFMA